MKEKKSCKVNGCFGEYYAKGLCKICYEKLGRTVKEPKLPISKSMIGKEYATKFLRDETSYYSRIITNDKFLVSFKVKDKSPWEVILSREELFMICENFKRLLS